MKIFNDWAKFLKRRCFSQSRHQQEKIKSMQERGYPLTSPITWSPIRHLSVKVVNSFVWKQKDFYSCESLNIRHFQINKVKKGWTGKPTFFLEIWDRRLRYKRQTFIIFKRNPQNHQKTNKDGEEVYNFFFSFKELAGWT